MLVGLCQGADRAGGRGPAEGAVEEDVSGLREDLRHQLAAAEVLLAEVRGAAQEARDQRREAVGSAGEAGRGAAEARGGGEEARPGPGVQRVRPEDAGWGASGSSLFGVRQPPASTTRCRSGPIEMTRKANSFSGRDLRERVCEAPSFRAEGRSKWRPPETASNLCVGGRIRPYTDKRKKIDLLLHHYLYDVVPKFPSVLSWGCVYRVTRASPGV